jgi:hypothetical protein
MRQPIQRVTKGENAYRWAARKLLEKASFQSMPRGLHYRQWHRAPRNMHTRWVRPEAEIP